MKDVQQILDYAPRTTLRLSEVERLIKTHRIIVPPLGRRTLISMCEDGTFETAGDEASRVGWLVFEDSFWKWVKSLAAGPNA